MNDLELVYDRLRSKGYIPYNIYYSGDYLRGISDNKNILGCYQNYTKSLLNVFENPHYYIKNEKANLYLLELKSLIVKYFNGEYFAIECLNNQSMCSDDFISLKKIIDHIPFPYHAFINEFEKEFKFVSSGRVNNHPSWVINDLQILSFFENKINNKINFEINKDYPIYDKIIDYYLKDELIPSSLFNSAFNFIQNKFNELKGFAYSKDIEKITQEHHNKVNDFVLEKRMLNYSSKSTT